MAEFQLELWVKKFLHFLRAERNVSPHTLRAYEKDLREFAKFSAAGGPGEEHSKSSLFQRKAQPDLPGMDSGAEGSASLSNDFRKCRLIVREYWASLSKRKLRDASIQRKLAALRSFFKYLVLEDVIVTNPFKYLPLPKREKILPRFLTEKEMSHFLAALERSGKKSARRDRALTELLYSSGLRIQEAVGLNVEDLDVWNGMVRVLGKGSKERVVPLGDGAARCIESYLQDRRRSEKALHYPKGPVFLNHLGKRLTTRGAHKVIRQWVKASAFEKRVSPHMFRHSFATHLLNRGCDLRTVQEMLGHKNLSTTQRYTHTTIEQLKRVYDGAHPRG